MAGKDGRTGAACPKCTYLNQEDAVICIICESALSTQLRPCPFCTMMGPPGPCDMCRAWQCDRCTAMHPEDLAQCPICNEEVQVDKSEKMKQKLAPKLLVSLDPSEATKVIRKAEKISPKLLSHIIDDPFSFVAQACGEIEKKAHPTEEGRMPLLRPPADEKKDETEQLLIESSSSDSFVSDTEEERADFEAADKLFTEHSIPNENVCGLCKAQYSTPALLRMHFLVRHIQNRQAVPCNAKKSTAMKKTATKRKRVPNESTRDTLIEASDDIPDDSLHHETPRPPRRILRRAAKDKTVAIDFFEERSSSADDQDSVLDDEEDCDALGKTRITARSAIRRSVPSRIILDDDDDDDDDEDDAEWNDDTSL